MNAACAMQNPMEDYNHGAKFPMHIRIGFHYGDVVCEAGKLFGDTITAFSTSKSYLIVGMLVQDILFILGLTEYPFLSYFFKDENAVHKNRIILVKT